MSLERLVPSPAFVLVTLRLKDVVFGDLALPSETAAVGVGRRGAQWRPGAACVGAWGRTRGSPPRCGVSLTLCSLSGPLQACLVCREYIHSPRSYSRLKFQGGNTTRDEGLETKAAPLYVTP